MIPLHHMMEALGWHSSNAKWTSFRRPRRSLVRSYDRSPLLWCTALLTILAALVTFLLVGCGAARPAKFYQLTVAQGTASPAPADSYPVGILIGPLFASHLYREDHIVFSSKGESMGTYEYERWVEPPTEMIQQVLFRALRSSGRFRSVHAQRSSSRGDYVLQGHLYSFEEVTGSPLAARLSLDIELRDSKTGSAVWSHVYNHDEPVSGKNISAVVAALDHNVQRATDEVTAGLFQYFSAHPPAVPAGPGAAQ